MDSNKKLKKLQDAKNMENIKNLLKGAKKDLDKLKVR